LDRKFLGDCQMQLLLRHLLLLFPQLQDVYIYNGVSFISFPRRVMKVFGNLPGVDLFFLEISLPDTARGGGRVHTYHILNTACSVRELVSERSIRQRGAVDLHRGRSFY
jgi:hypothetical protein